jgi:hypothetical protein
MNYSREVMLGLDPGEKDQKDILYDSAVEEPSS